MIPCAPSRGHSIVFVVVSRDGTAAEEGAEGVDEGAHGGGGGVFGVVDGRVEKNLLLHVKVVSSTTRETTNHEL